MSCQGSKGNKCGSPILDDPSAGSVDDSQLVFADSLGSMDKQVGNLESSMEVDPVRKSSRVSRSPPPRGDRSIAALLAGTNKARSSSVGSTAGLKRGREEYSQGGELDEVMKILSKMTAASEGLMKLIRTNVNTKAEIKQGIKEIYFQLEILNRKSVEWSELPTNPKMRQTIRETTTCGTQVDIDLKETQSVGCALPKNTATCGTQVDLKETRSVGIQVDLESVMREEERKRQEDIKAVESVIGQGSDFEGLSQILDKSWPEEVFKVSTLDDSGVLDPRTGGDLAVVLDPDIDGSDKRLKDISLLCPETPLLLQEGLMEGQIEYIRSSTATISSRGEKGEKSNTLYFLPFATGNHEVNDIPVLHSLLDKLKIEMTAHKSTAVKVLAMGSHNLDYLRKCCEAVFRTSGCTVKILIETDVGKKRRKSQGATKANKPRRPQTDKVIIKSEGKTYADLLRTIKSSVDVTEMGVEVKSLKKTKNGHLLLEVSGDKDKVTSLKNTIKTKTTGTEVFVKHNEATIHVTDIEADIDENELKREIIKHGVGISEDHVRVVSLRPTKGGNQTATVKVKKDVAAELVRRGKIKIGWGYCRLRYRVNVVRCYRCLEFGHHASTCTGPDKSDICVKCGAQGHKAKDCNERKTFCTSCSKEGHRSDTTRCPRFRKVIKDMTDDGGEERRNVKGNRNESPTN